MADPQIEHVSDTAFWVAHFRAVETGRPDALFRDPLAAVLAGDRGKAIAESMPAQLMTEWALTVRTRLLDDYIEAAVAQGSDAVLNLGAGLDTRPYRLKIPESLLWVEADYPATIDFKERRLAKETPRCRLERVRIDLNDDAARRAMLTALDGRAKKLLVVSEGVTPYLTPEQVGALADDLRSLQSVCGWTVDYASPAAIKWGSRARKKRFTNAPWRFTPPDWSAFFREHGWRVKAMYYYVPEGRRLGRPIRLPPFLRFMTKIVLPFVPSKKRAKFAESRGTAVLEPAGGG